MTTKFYTPRQALDFVCADRRYWLFRDEWGDGEHPTMGPLYAVFSLPTTAVAEDVARLEANLTADDDLGTRLLTNVDRVKLCEQLSHWAWQQERSNARYAIGFRENGKWYDSVMLSRAEHLRRALAAICQNNPDALDTFISHAQAYGRVLHRYAEHVCNRGEDAHQRGECQRIKKVLARAWETASGPAELLEFNGDPRGAPIKIRIPEVLMDNEHVRAVRGFCGESIPLGLSGGR